MTIDLNQKYASAKAARNATEQMIDLLTEKQECEDPKLASEQSDGLKQSLKNKASNKASRGRKACCILSFVAYLSLHAVGYLTTQRLELIVTMVLQIVLTALAAWKLYRVIDEGEGWIGLILFGLLDIGSLFYFPIYNLTAGVGIFAYLSSIALVGLIAICGLCFAILTEKSYYKRLCKSPATRAAMAEAEAEDRETAAENKKRLKEISVELGQYRPLYNAMIEYVTRARDMGIPALPDDDVEVMRRLLGHMDHLVELAEKAQNMDLTEADKKRFHLSPNELLQKAYDDFFKKQEEMQASADRARALAHDIFGRR